MRSTSSKLRPTTPRFRRLARASLGLLGFAVLVAACSAAPTEKTQVSASRITGTPGLLGPFSGDGQITNGNGGCLDLPNGDTKNGNLLHIWDCDSSGQNQTWYLDGNSIHYGNDPSKCVDFPAQALSNGVPVNETQLQIWDCNGASGPDQVWHTTWAGNIQFAADTAKCVELRNGGYPLVNGSAQDGTPVQVYDCNGTSGQTWQFVQGGGVQCGANGEGACSSGNSKPPLHCNPSLELHGVMCSRREVLTASTSIPADGNGGVVADVTFTAVSTGTLAMTPVISNSDQLTGYDYILKCNVGDHQVAYRGNVGNAGFNAFGGSWTHDSPGTMGMKSPEVYADWANIRKQWSPPMGKDNFKCILTVSSTFQQSLDQVWSVVASAYLKQFGLDSLTSGDMCFLQTCNNPAGCTAKCIEPGSSQCAAVTCDLDE